MLQAVPLADLTSAFHAQVIVLRMVKPPSFRAVPGMFIFLNLPCIAKAGAPVSRGTCMLSKRHWHTSSPAPQILMQRSAC